MKSSESRKLWPVALAMIDSGLLYTIGVVAHLAAFLTGSNGQFCSLGILTPLIVSTFYLNLSLKPVIRPLILFCSFRVGFRASPFARFFFKFSTIKRCKGTSSSVVLALHYVSRSMSRQVYQYCNLDVKQDLRRDATSSTLHPNSLRTHNPPYF